MVIDVHSKNVNCVNNMEKKQTLSEQLEAKSKQPQHKYMAAHFRFTHEKGRF